VVIGSAALIDRRVLRAGEAIVVVGSDAVVPFVPAKPSWRLE